jgi:integrase
MKLSTYLAVNRYGIWYYRTRIPSDLRARFPHSQIRRSTKTTDERQALELARVYASHAANLFRGMRMHRNATPNDAAFCMLYKADLSALGLGLHQIEYDSSNEVEKQEADRQIGQLRTFIGTREHVSTKPATAALSTVIAEFMQEQDRSKAGATVEKYKHSLRCFVELSGDMPITSVSQTTLGAFKKQMARLPRHATKNPPTRGKSVKELVVMEFSERIADRTLNTHLRNVVSFLRWARGHYSGVQALTSDKLAISIKARADEERAVFTDADLSKIFGAGFSDLPAHKRYLLLCGLYSGARIEELCQLDLMKDVYQDEGIWIFDFNDLDDKNLKTKASKRKVPISQTLLELGILEYFESVKARGHTRPFPEWEPYKGKFSKNASKWAGRWFDVCGVTDKRKVYHSYRHTALDRMKQAGIHEGHAAAVAGQTYGGISYSRYGKAFPPSALLDAVAAIDFPLLRAALGLKAKVLPVKAVA